jgi:hypothetical protein
MQGIYSLLAIPDVIRMVAPAIGRRRVQRGLRWAKNPSGHTRYTDVFLVAHGLMPDEIASASVLRFLWHEATAPSPVSFSRGYSQVSA